jgi:dihydrofolate reductase
MSLPAPAGQKEKPHHDRGGSEMARVIYGMGVSLDGFVEDADGDFGWSAPAEDVHRLANQQAREASALVFGRAMYEVMEPFWPQAAQRTDLPEVEAEFARAYVETPRIVVSDSLESVPDGVRLVRRADAAAEVRRLKEQPGGHVDIGGPTLAAALADLIDEFRMWVNPVIVGAGKRFLPPVRARLTLLEARSMSDGVLYLRYERA